MGQAISNFVANLCGGDTGQDEIQSSTRASPTHIFPQRPGPQLIPTPLRWSRGSDSFTHPVTVRDRIVRNPPPGSNHAGGSTSWTRDVSQLGLGLGHLVIRDLSDSFTHSVTNSVRNRIVRNPPPGSDPAGESTSWSREVSQLDLGHLVTRDVSDSFTHSGTNSVRNWIVRNPTPGSDPDGYSSSQTREVSQLGHGHLVTRDESDSVSQLGRDPVISSSNWLEEFLGDSSITVGTDTIEVLKEGIERDEERDTIPIQSQISELLQNRLSSSHGADLVAHTVPIPPPGSDPVLDSTSPSSESDSVNQLRRDPAITLPKWLDVSLKDSSVTVLEEKKEVVREVLREERERYGKRGRGGKVGRVERWMKHYSSFHKILLVGEGDFSFSACLAVAFGCAHNIIATSLDSTGKTNKPRLVKLRNKILAFNYRNKLYSVI